MKVVMSLRTLWGFSHLGNKIHYPESSAENTTLVAAHVFHHGGPR